MGLKYIVRETLFRVILLIGKTPLGPPLQKIILTWIKWRTVLFRQIDRHEAVSSDSKKCSRFPRHVLVLCHANYLDSLGGTEKVIYEQASAFAGQNVGTVAFFPMPKSIFSLNKKRKYGCLVDGELVENWFSGAQLASICEKFKFVHFFIHHLKDWQLADCENLISQVSEKPVFFVHDFYAVCPSINFSCLNNSANSQFRGGCFGGKCSQRYSAGLMNAWRLRFGHIIEKCQRTVVPSLFVKHSLEKYFPDLLAEVVVEPPALLSAATRPCAERSQGKIKIAYLGYGSPIKGYDLWRSIIEDPRLRNLYDFVQVGGTDQADPLCKSIAFNHYKDGRQRAVEILLEENVDIVLLWSTVPETFSFTLHEALAAGKTILTGPQSGNIAAVVRELDVGMVLENEKALRDLLLDSHATRDMVRKIPARSLSVNTWFLSKETVP